MMRQTTRTSPHRSAPREPHRTSSLITKLFDRHKPFQRNGASIASRSNSRHRTRQAGRANPPSTQNQATPLVLTKTKPGPHPSPRLRYGPFFTSWTTDAIKKKKKSRNHTGCISSSTAIGQKSDAKNQVIRKTPSGDRVYSCVCWRVHHTGDLREVSATLLVGEQRGNRLGVMIRCRLSSCACWRARYTVDVGWYGWYSCHAWLQSYDHRPAHPYNSRTRHVGYSPRQENSRSEKKRSEMSVHPQMMKQTLTPGFPRVVVGVSSTGFIFEAVLGKVSVGEKAGCDERPAVEDEADPLPRGGEPHGRPSVLGIARFAIDVDVPPVRQHHGVEHGDQDHHHVEPPALQRRIATTAATGKRQREQQQQQQRQQQKSQQKQQQR